MKSSLLAGLCFTLGSLLVTLSSRAGEATEAESAWFAGEWAVAPAPVEGFDTIVAKAYPNVRIEHRGGTRIARISSLRNGASVAVEFDVRSFKGNFPWWAADGGANAVARRVDQNTFDLAGVGPMGKADWGHALRHTRVIEPMEAEQP
jgi:hypothetical protein